MRYETIIIEPLRDMLVAVTSFVPTLLIGLGVLVIGCIAVRLLHKVVGDLFNRIGLDKLADIVGLTDLMKNGGVKYKPSELLARGLHLALMVSVVIMTIRAFGLTVASEIIDSVFAYVPHLVSGAFILIVGMLVAKILSGFVYFTAKATDMPIPETIAKLTKWAVMLFISIKYLTEVGFFGLFTDVHFTHLVSGIIFAVALAFGLAGKDIASKYLDVFKK
jgi:Conserved TM helix